MVSAGHVPAKMWPVTGIYYKGGVAHVPYPNGGCFVTGWHVTSHSKSKSFGSFSMITKLKKGDLGNEVKISLKFK